MVALPVTPHLVRVRARKRLLLKMTKDGKVIMEVCLHPSDASPQVTQSNDLIQGWLKDPSSDLIENVSRFFWEFNLTFSRWYFSGI